MDLREALLGMAAPWLESEIAADPRLAGAQVWVEAHSQPINQDTFVAAVAMARGDKLVSAPFVVSGLEVLVNGKEKLLALIEERLETALAVCRNELVGPGEDWPQRDAPTGEDC